MSTLLSNLNGNFKQVYGGRLPNLIPADSKLQRMVGFSKEDKLGAQFNYPVVVTQENGLTYAGPDEDGYTLNPAIGMQTKNATLKGNQMVLRSLLGVKAAKASQGSKAAFVKATKLLVMNMMDSISKRLEASLLYGNAALATVSAVSGAVITVKDYAPGLFVGAEGAKLDVYNGSTKRGTNSIKSVDIATNKITLNAAITGVAANDAIRFADTTGKEMDGLAALLSKTGSQTLHGITVSDFSAWQPNHATAFGEVTFKKLIQALEAPINKGLSGDVTVICSPKVQLKLIADADDKRRFDSSYSMDKVQEGAMGVRFKGPNGTLDITSHLFCKTGDIFVIRPGDFKRIGAADVGFLGQSDPEGDDKFQLESGTMGYALKIYTDQALLCKKPSCQLYIQGATTS